MRGDEAVRTSFLCIGILAYIYLRVELTVNERKRFNVAQIVHILYVFQKVLKLQRKVHVTLTVVSKVRELVL